MCHETLSREEVAMKKLYFAVLMTVIAFSMPAVAAPAPSMNDISRDDGTGVGAGTKAKPPSLPDITPNALKEPNEHWTHAPKLHAPKVHAPKVHVPKVHVPKVHVPKVHVPKVKPPKIKPPKHK
jgi:hypothetical protein